MAVDKKKHGKGPAKSSKPESAGKKFSGKRDFGKNANKNAPKSIKDFLKKDKKDFSKKRDFGKKTFDSKKKDFGGKKSSGDKKPFAKKENTGKKDFPKKSFGDKKSFDKKDSSAAKKDFSKKRKDFDGKDNNKEKKSFKKDFAKKPKSSHGDANKPTDAASYRAKKPYFKLVETIKSSWNKVRDHSTAAEARANLVAEMVKNIKTHVLDVTLRHDASRMVQTILQFGNDAQREIVLKELHEKMFEIAKTPYGHFAVLKAITYCTEQSAMKKIVSALQKHFVSLGTHVIGARTVESILQLYPVALTRSLKAEFYGKNFSILLPETPKSLRDVIEQLPAKRISALDHMRDLIAKLAQKQLLEFTYVHHLLYEYTQELQLLFDEATTSAGKAEGKEKHQQLIDDLVNQLADSAPKLLSTKPGAKAMCFVITHAPAKDRKRIIKSLKGHCLESLLHDSAFLGVMRLVDLTDDTVNVQKSFFDELKANEQSIKYTATGEVSSKHEAPWLAIAKHPNASKLLLRLLSPQKRHLEPDEEVLFQTASVHSKKDPALRRKEHVTFLRQVLLKVLSPHVEELLRSRSGSRVLEALVEVYHPRDLVQNIALAFAGQEVVVAEPVEEEEEEEEEYDEEEEGDEEDMGVMDDEFDGEGEEEEGEDEDDVEEEEEREEEEEDNNEEEEGDAEGDEEYEEQLEEAKQDLKEAANKQKKAKIEAAPAAPVLPIEEDPVAHIVLKRLLRWESSLETQENAADMQESIRVLQEYEKQREHKEKDNGITGPVDKSLWVEDSEENGPVSLAQSLWEQLSADEYALLRKWISCNRPSFALHELLRVPSIFVHIEKLFADLSEELSDAALEKHEGGKTLKRLHAAFVASQEVKTKVTKKEESQDKKKKTSKKK